MRVFARVNARAYTRTTTRTEHEPLSNRISASCSKAEKQTIAEREQGSEGDLTTPNRSNFVGIVF